MRILVTMGHDPNTLASCYVRGLSGSSCEIDGINLSRPHAAPAGLVRRATRRLSPGIAFPEANAALASAVSSRVPDVVWIFKGMEIYPATLRRLRRQGITLVNYNADHPFLHFSYGSGNANVRDAIPLYDLHLTYSERIARELKARNPDVKVAVVPFGHDVSEEVFERIAGEEEVMRACFLGNPDDHRRQNIERLTRAGVAMDVYGHGWDKFLVPSPLLKLCAPALGEDMLRVLRRYRVQLNFLRPHNADSHNMRTFEVPASGGIMLAQDSIEHRALFEEGREAFYFDSTEEMIARTRQILAMTKDEAGAVRAAARSRSVESGYSYRDRALAALAEIKALRTGQ